MATFPVQGEEPWDNQLFSWLTVSLNADGTLQPGAVTAGLQPGAVAASLGARIAPVATGNATIDTANLTAAINSAIAAVPSTLIVTGGNYHLNAALPIIPPRVDVIPSGQVVFTCSSAGAVTFMRQQNTAFPTSGNPPAVWAPTNQAGKIGPFIIDLTNAGAGSVGLQVGDIYAPDVYVLIVNGTSAGTIGFLLQSTVGWCERGKYRVITDNCAIGVQRNGNGLVANNSFDYSDFWFSIRSEPNQDGLQDINLLSMVGGSTTMYGNFEGNSSSNTGTAWKYGSDATAVSANGHHFAIFCENDTGTVGHVPLNIGATATLFGRGSIQFLASGGVWKQGVGTNLPNGFVGFAGEILVDNTWGKRQAGEAQQTIGAVINSKGLSTISGGNATIAMQTGNTYSFTLANGSNVIKLNNVYGGRARKAILIVTQPASGAAGTIDWTTPGNNVLGNAQTFGFTPTLSTANGAVDIVELVTIDEQHWYAFNLSAGAPVAGPERALLSSTQSIAVGLSSTYGVETDFIPDSPALGLIPMFINWTVGSYDSGTVNISVQATFSDSTTSSIVTPAGVTSDVTTAVGQLNFPTLWKDGVYITQLAIKARSTAASTTATVSVTLVGQNVI